MSAGLAHEFKNAIATLHGYAQLLQNLNLDERGQNAASSLLNEVRNLSDMVTAFLNFARPQPLQMEDVALSDLIKECVAELKTLYNDRRIDLIVAPEISSLPQVRADERMLRQTLLNLLRNAAEAIPDDNTERTVIVSGLSEVDREGDKWVAIEIEDSGKGIPQSDLQRIFIPFFTTKEKGHGIGLALAHRVITEHGGTLTASNRTPPGATFTVRLPVASS